MALSLNDYILQGTGGPSVNDGLFSWYGTNGGTGNSLQDRAMSFLISKGYTTGTLQDRWFAYLGSLGYTQNSLQDRFYAFWAAGGIISGFSPSELFQAGEVGVWYDPSDFSTLYQDTSGTTPVTAVEQPVGLMLDKSQGLVLGSELVTNGTFDTDVSGWTTQTAGTTLTWSSGSAECTTTATGGFYKTFTTEAGKWYEASASTSAATGAHRLRIVNNAVTGTILSETTDQSAPSSFSLKFLATSAISVVYCRHNAASTQTWDNISVKQIAGNHAVAANNGTARPVLKSTGGLYYLAFTTDDAMSTASIDFSGTDEMTVFAGVTKNSDAAAGCLIELSANYSLSNGTFTVFAPGSNFPTGFDTPYRGTSTVTAPGFAAAAPTTKIITNLYDISSPSAIIRSNGSQVFSSTTSAGTGNFGNHPLYIGARNKSASFLNGSLYSLIVRGKTSTVDEIHSTENYVAGKTGIGSITWAYDMLVDDSGNQIVTDADDPIYVNEIVTITPP